MSKQVKVTEPLFPAVANEQANSNPGLTIGGQDTDMAQFWGARVMTVWVLDTVMVPFGSDSVTKNVKKCISFVTQLCTYFFTKPFILVVHKNVPFTVTCT